MRKFNMTSNGVTNGTESDPLNSSECAPYVLSKLLMAGKRTTILSIISIKCSLIPQLFPLSLKPPI